MRQILMYVLILLSGAFLVRKNLIPEIIKKRLGLLQSMSLFILLGTMGYKIGIDDKIIANFTKIGFKAGVFSVCTVVFSVFITFILFKISFMFSKKEEEGDK